jgi:hypothetical protein
MRHRQKRQQRGFVFPDKRYQSGRDGSELEPFSLHPDFASGLLDLSQ